MMNIGITNIYLLLFDFYKIARVKFLQRLDKMLEERNMHDEIVYRNQNQGRGISMLIGTNNIMVVMIVMITLASSYDNFKMYFHVTQYLVNILSE